MRISRKLRALLGLLMAFTLLAAACGDDSDSSSSDTTAAEGSTETTAGGETSDLTVGLAYDLGGRGDQSFNDSAAAGLEQGAEEFGIETEELEPDEGGENRQELLQLLCDNGTDLIFAEEQGSFLVGAAAALTTATDHVGFIGGVNTELIQKFQAGYEAGVAAVDPAITVDVEYLTEPPDFDGFNAPDRGREVAASMYEGGADIVYAAAGGSGSGVFEAAQAARDAGGDAWAIGVDSDQYNTADPAVQDVILTSMLKQVNVAVYNTIASAVAGDEVGGQTTVFDLSVDGVGYSTSGDFLSEETITALEDYKQQIIDGEIEVPTVPE